MSSPHVDRLAILTISGTQADVFFTHLASEKFDFTVIENQGGMLQEPEVCLLVGFQRERMQVLLVILRKDCHPFRKFVSTQGYMQGEMASQSIVEVESGGARFCVMDVERFEQI